MLAGGATAQIEHVIHISFDGLRGDMLRTLMETQAYSYPNFVKLRAEGASTLNARCDHGVSLTIPNHTSMLTGLPLKAVPGGPAWQQHGYTNNYPGPDQTLHANGVPAGYKPSVFDRVHDRGLRTMLLGSKEKFGFYDRSYDAQHGAPDLDGVDNGRDKIDVALVRDADSSVLIAVLTAFMDADFPAYTFIHVFDPDSAGHVFGWGTLEWVLSVKQCDALLGLIFSALELRPALKSVTAVVVTADHGGGVPAKLHDDPAAIENYTIPVFLWGPGIPRRVDAHSLFLNRTDPGASRPENDAPSPPLRNGDTGNIALALLGLPAIEGSLYQPVWAGQLEVATTAEGEIECAWPRLWAGWVLESTTDLNQVPWSRVEAAPVASSDGARWVYKAPRSSLPQQYFRLRGPQ